MNVANKLTILRIVLTPVFLVLMLLDFPFHYLAAGLVFGAAALTDLLDGHLARKYQLVTNMGKFLDPLADKMLTTAAFLAFMAMGQMNIWAVMLILTREFMVMSIRLTAAAEGTVIAASFFGKAKTVAQYVGILFATWQQSVLANAGLPEAVFTVPITISSVLLWVAAILTVISGIQYVYNGRRFFKNS